MTTFLAEILGHIEPDPWRAESGFSADLEGPLVALLDARTDESRASQLSVFLEHLQPCLFGRIAAKQRFLTYCFVTEAEIMDSDERVHAKLQEVRTHWKRDALAGSKSGFVIAVLSDRLARGLPSAHMLAFAQRLTSLYLLCDVDADEIYLDSLRLELSSGSRPTWEWDVGVNYFSAQGDKRWWHDHRIPAGMALSMNSVGHMVRSDILRRGLNAVAAAMEVEPEADSFTRVESLDKALVLAMRTIDKAAPTSSGVATYLVNTSGDGTTPKCPVALPPNLAQKDPCRYMGFYHTDVTLPSAYFVAAVDRPTDAKPLALDFTYLFDSSLDNPAHSRMGPGVRVRDSGAEAPKLNPADELAESAIQKRRKAVGRTVDRD